MTLTFVVRREMGEWWMWWIVMMLATRRLKRAIYLVVMTGEPLADRAYVNVSLTAGGFSGRFPFWCFYVVLRGHSLVLCWSGNGPDPTRVSDGKGDSRTPQVTLGHGQWAYHVITRHRSIGRPTLHPKLDYQEFIRTGSGYSDILCKLCFTSLMPCVSRQ